MDKLFAYLYNKGIAFSFSKQGTVKFTWKDRQFFYTKSGWFTSLAKNPTRGSYGRYIVFKTKEPIKNGRDMRDSINWRGREDNLIIRIEKSGILN